VGAVRLVVALGPAMPRNRFCTVKTSLTTFRNRVMDWDADSGNEWLMSPSSYYPENATSGTFTYDFSRSSLKVTRVNAPNR
jgi:hypothetical protein